MLWLVGALILLGIVGTVVPLFPGPVLVAAGLIIFGFSEGTASAWLIAGIGLALLAAGAVLKWLIPARHMSGSVQVPILLAGSVAAVVGFFVIPVVGLPIGFVAGVLLAETIRLRSVRDAWPATRQAVQAAGVSMLIELTSVTLAASVWLGGMWLTR